MIYLTSSWFWIDFYYNYIHELCNNIIPKYVMFVDWPVNTLFVYMPSEQTKCTCIQKIT